LQEVTSQEESFMPDIHVSGYIRERVHKFQAACISTTFLPCILMNETEYNGECCGCFTACDVKRSRSMG